MLKRTPIRFAVLVCVLRRVPAPIMTPPFCSFVPAERDLNPSVHLLVQPPQPDGFIHTFMSTNDLNKSIDTAEVLVELP